MRNLIVHDLCCGSGGWATGLRELGYEVIGYDVEDQPLYPGTFVRCDVRAISAHTWKNDAFIVASPPCEQFSRHQMPWTRAKSPPEPDLSIVESCRRLQLESGLPMVMENVRAAQGWLGKAKSHVGPYYLWGDIPSVLPFSAKFRKKESYGSKDRLARARVPIELSRFVGEYLRPMTCGFCGYVFDGRCGMFGCPNCHGEGIELGTAAAKGETTDES
jgi:hypothetical protein